jgi:dipeptidyl aminopeptidase/acylaminoacyl peptidase
MLLYDIEKGRSRVFQDAEYGSINPSDFSDAECVKYKSKDGTEIEAILYKPKDIKPNEKVPAVVFVHGGPYGQDTLRFDIYAQFITSLGFAVLQPNFRGSIGYGKAFKEAVIKDWGGKDAEDVVTGAEYLKKMDWIDGNRIVVAGGSYGGYATYWQMVRYPEVWGGGIAWVGITDLLKLYEESMPHFKYFLRESMGDPEKDRDLWIERSPITHAKNLKSPLLIVHGVNDPRCPISQARIFRDKLIELGLKEGKDFEYIELSKEGHGSTDKEQKIRIFKLMAEFLRQRFQ